MSASNPGPVRRFFRGVWRVVDVSRRVVLNLLLPADPGRGRAARWCAAARRRWRRRPRWCSTFDGRSSSSAPATCAATALDQLRGEHAAADAAARRAAVLDAAAKDDKITQRRAGPRRARRRRPGRRCARSAPRSSASRPPASRSWPGARATTSASTTWPPTPTRSGCIRWATVNVKASAAISNYYKDALDQRRRQRQRDARRHVQELRRDLRRQRPSPETLRGRRGAARRAVDHLHRRASRRRASCPPAA